MIYKQKIHTDFQIKTLKDLVKLKPVLEDGTLDQILHHAHVVNLTGRSYRLREYMTQEDEWTNLYILK